MLLALILIPFLAAIGILGGLPARLTAVIASLANILVATYALSCPACSDGFSLQVLADPKINLSLGITGISAVMLILSVIITLAAVYSGKCPEGREKLW